MAIHDPRTSGTFATSRSSIGDPGLRGPGVVQALAVQTGHKSFAFETLAGIVTGDEHADGAISVDMGRPRLGWREIPIAKAFDDTTAIELELGPLRSPSVASMGNPHATFWVEDDVWSYDLERLGPVLEHDAMFPERANISIARVIARERVILRTWERGAGLTRACGTAACAALVNGVRTGRTARQAAVTLPGGDLRTSSGAPMTT